MSDTGSNNEAPQGEEHEGELDAEDVEAEVGEEEEEEEVGETGDANVDEVPEDERRTSEQHDGEEEKAKDHIGDTAGTDINITSFDDLVLEPAWVSGSQEAWRIFISTAESREAAGEAIYAALFEGAPSLQSLFTTPRAVQAMRFMNGLASFVMALDDPPKLKILVETLGFGHLHLDVTIPRVIIFRDAILDLFQVELAERFNSAARNGWKKLLNYVGGAIIYCKVNYAERITCLLRSWKKVNHNEDEEEDAGDGMEMAAATTDQVATKQAATTKKKSRWNKVVSGKNKDQGDTEDAHTKESDGGNKNIGAQKIPTTYGEMFLFNAAVMGFGTSTWMNEVLICFDNIVLNVANSARLQEECDILALRIARVVKGSVNLAEYKSCMLASLRSLLPKDWNSAHEVAWTWLWENVERLVKKIEGLPAVWEKCLSKILNSLDEETKFEVRKDIYSRAFTLAPAIQDFFKQSNTYLHFIADKILAMTVELYQNPSKMVDDVSALGLRHVGYAIPTELFGPFVTACVEVLMARTSDEQTIESFRWSLGLISKMLVRTITEGSTLVMKAINSNSQKFLKKAISCAPRGQRSNWMLIVQVGTQSISPLAWSIESGQTEASVAMIRDLLTFRADRDRYYYGVDDLFNRHPDIIKMLCENAPHLIPKLLDGLIWRSRTTENGLRRVNYYVKHLLIDTEGQLSPTLNWIRGTQDPKLVCHPVVVMVSDIIWSKVAYRSFLYGKLWLVFTLCVFLFSQSILEHLHEEKSDPERITVFACRCFIYVLSMPPLIYNHMLEFIKAYKTKNTMKIGCIPIPKYLRQWQDMASFSLTISLLVMLCLEPILWCWEHQGGVLFLGRCKQQEDMRMAYTTFAMFAMFFYYSLLVDVTVVSTRVSAFVLVCVRMIPEMCLFLGALVFCILTFSSAVSVLKNEIADFQGIHKGMYALLRVSLRAYSAEGFKGFRDEPSVLAIIFVFCVTTVIFLLNMLIAQLSCAYSSVYEDMVGFARLERASIIVEVMPSIPKWRWTRFVESLHLNKKLEFNPGDIGIAGGLRFAEPANANPTTVDMIRRFGGSTSVDIQWPEDDQDSTDGDDRLDKLEKLIQKTLQRVTKSGGSGRGGKGGSSTGQSSSNLDSKHSGGEGSSGSDDA